MLLGNIVTNNSHGEPEVVLLFLLPLLTTFLLCSAIGRVVIKLLRSKQADGQPMRDFGPTWHNDNKKGTPTMGGIMIIISLWIGMIVWSGTISMEVFTMLLIATLFAAIGFIDDYAKLVKKSGDGISGILRLSLEFFIVIAAFFALLILSPAYVVPSVNIPFMDTPLYLGYLYPIFAALVVVGTANAVNLTDGLDGLASVPVLNCAIFFAIVIAIYAGNAGLDNMDILYDMNILLGALSGGCLGFLWYNAKPAYVFMGDTGSLFLGGLIGTVAVFLRVEYMLVVVGSLFVVEAISVILQVMSYKMRAGKRIFLMAPIHHHFEKMGWSETHVVIRFWIFSLLSLVLALVMIEYNPFSVTGGMFISLE